MPKQKRPSWHGRRSKPKSGSDSNYANDGTKSGGWRGSFAEGSSCVPCGNFLSACGTNTKATACHAGSQAGSFDASVKCKCPSAGAACSWQPPQHPHPHPYPLSYPHIQIFSLEHSYTRFQLARPIDGWLAPPLTNTRPEQIVCHLMAAGLCAYIKAYTSATQRHWISARKRANAGLGKRG